MSHKHCNSNCGNNLGIGGLAGSSPIIIIIVIAIIFCGNRGNNFGSRC